MSKPPADLAGAKAGGPIMSARPSSLVAIAGIALAALSLARAATAQPVNMARSYAAGAAAPPREDCVPMNSDKLSVVNAGGGFSIYDGSSMLENVPTKAQAEGIITVMRKYGFTEQCFVSRGRTIVTTGYVQSSRFEYFKRNGAVPHLVRDGLNEDCLQIPANESHVILYGNTPGLFAVVSGASRFHPENASYMMVFPHDQATAEQAAAILNRYHVDQECFVGRGDTGFTYWLTQPQGPGVRR